MIQCVIDNKVDVRSEWVVAIEGTVRRRPEGAAIDLRQAERRVARGHDDVGVAHEADAAAEAVPVHRGDDGHLALVDRGERLVAPVVGAEQRLMPRRALHLLDVDPRVEPFALGGEDQHAHRRILPQAAHEARELVPPSDVERVDGRVAHDDLGDAVGDRMGDGHGARHGE